MIPTTQQPNDADIPKILKTNSFHYFCYVGHVSLALKINKIKPNILQKTTIKTMPQLGWILMPTWFYFGKVVGAKMNPSWFQIAPKANRKIITF